MRGEPSFNPSRRRSLAWAALAGSGACGWRQARAEAVSGFNAQTMAALWPATGVLPAAEGLIELLLPQTAENGAVVAVQVMSRLPDTRQIWLLAEANPAPLVASFSFPAGTEAFVSTRIKLAQSGTVHAWVQAGEQWFGSHRDTRVIAGACTG